ncbi:hypothetical protein DZ897_026460, partial [Pseudomonas aeruginosa]|nr:hypothetical protein [Pseudomonas aeruginosa]
MTELLSREEYAAIAATLDLPQRAFIDGGFRDACGGRTFASTNPATGELLWNYQFTHHDLWDM